MVHYHGVMVKKVLIKAARFWAGTRSTKVRSGSLTLVQTSLHMSGGYDSPSKKLEVLAM